ncbi:hypothetical protein NL676_018867 [Syzygium grande]|nr:hypothetical protein NL676_018867 [Syzygium grande]
MNMAMAFVRRFALTLLGLLLVFNFVRGQLDTTVVNRICNGNVYGSGDPYANSVSYVLWDMVTVTANHPGYDYYTQSPFVEATAYGHAVCARRFGLGGLRGELLDKHSGAQVTAQTEKKRELERTSDAEKRKSESWSERKRMNLAMAFVRRVALTLLGLLFVFTFVRGDPDVTQVNKICNGNVYASGDPYANSVSYVLEDMATVTANHPGYDYYTQSPYAEATAYGHAVCSTTLSFTDCATCVGRVLGLKTQAMGGLGCLTKSPEFTAERPRARICGEPFRSGLQTGRTGLQTK